MLEGRNQLRTSSCLAADPVHIDYGMHLDGDLVLSITVITPVMWACWKLFMKGAARDLSNVICWTPAGVATALSLFLRFAVVPFARALGELRKFFHRLRMKLFSV